MENETTGAIISELIKTLATLPGLTTLIRIFQTAGIILIAYLIFLFFKSITNYKTFSRIKHMDQTLESINITLIELDKKLTSQAKQKSKK
jgi:hypothetical protein